MLGSPCKEKSSLWIGTVVVISSSKDTTSPSALIDFRDIVSKLLTVILAAKISMLSVAVVSQPGEFKIGTTSTSQYVGELSSLIAFTS